jgi:secondary thiamine-phosphate synthase enzyme
MRDSGTGTAPGVEAWSGDRRRGTRYILPSPDAHQHYRDLTSPNPETLAPFLSFMRQAVHTIVVATGGKGLIEITGAVADWLARQKMATGLLTIFCRHTSASLVIQENADADVRTDIEAFFERMVPENPGGYVHDAEGPDDMPAHLKAMLTQTQLAVPVVDARMVLGIWQGIYVFEHRRAPHRREIVLHLIGE